MSDLNPFEKMLLGKLADTINAKIKAMDLVSLVKTELQVELKALQADNDHDGVPDATEALAELEQGYEHFKKAYDLLQLARSKAK